MKEITFNKSEIKECAVFVATLEKQGIAYNLCKEVNGYITVMITGY